MTKGICYYSDNRGDPRMLTAVQRQLLKASGDIPIIAVTLQPVEFGTCNIVLPQERSRLSMFQQILAGLQALDTDCAFLCEHDVLYHPSHFDFEPPKDDVYYYNENVWKVDLKTGQALFYWTKQTSGLCANRQLLVNHYTARVERTMREGYNHRTGYEPGAHKPPHGIDSFPRERYMSAWPNIDIRHGCNLTMSRWSQDLFRDKSTCQGWTMADEVPGWGLTKGNMEVYLAGA